MTTQQDFSRRSTATELMDTDPVSFKEFDDYRAYQRFDARLPSDGGGNAAVEEWARGKNLKLDLTGVDVNPGRQDRRQSPRRRRCPSVLKQPTSSLEWIRSGQILSSVRLSPITSETRIWFVLSAGWTRYAAHGWFINDLQRHILPYFFIKYATRFLPVNRMARHDGPRFGRASLCSR